MKALIIANGEVPTTATITHFAKQADLVLATDGAANKTSEQLLLSHICGDFDSIDREQAHLRYPQARLVELPDQNSSDLEKTVDFAQRQGVDEIIIAGALGGRVDHTLVLFSLLIKLHPVTRISVVDDHSQTFFISPECIHQGYLSKQCAAEETISLISFADQTCITIQGVRWPLNSFNLPPGSHGVSNRALGGVVTVSVRQGIAAVSLPWTIHGNQSGQISG